MDVRRVDQLRQLSFPECRKISHIIRFSKTGRLRCTGATRRTQNKVVKQLGKPRRNSCAYLPLRKSDERRFSQAGGRISQCLAAERRGKNMDVRRVEQLRQLSFPECRKISHIIRFSKTGRLRCTGATRRTQNKVVKQLGKPRRNSCAYLPLRKSDAQVGGRISQCLAAERRGVD